MTHSQRTCVVSLFRIGYTFAAITSRTGIGRKEIAQYLSDADISTQGKTFTVVSDPSGTYLPGESTFDQGNVCASLWLGTWEDGMEFVERVTGEKYKVVEWMHEGRNGVRIRQILVGDGIILRPENIHALRREPNEH